MPYDVHKLPISARQVAYIAALDPTQRVWVPAPFGRPLKLTIDADGDVAAVVRATNPRTGRYGDVIRVMRRGVWSTVDFPPDDVVAQRLLIPALDARRRATYASAYFREVALAGSRIVATVAQQFAGAFGGIESAAFAYGARQWSPVSRTDEDRSNTWIGAADASGNMALVKDNFNGGPVEWEREQAQPHYNDDRIVGVRNGRERLLGNGIATSIEGATVVGYDAGTRAYVDAWPRATVAIAYHGSRRKDLGHGVAWAVNEAGVIVGDNRRDIVSAGLPVVWMRGKQMVLSRESGAAFGVSRDGTVVGDVGSGAFIASLTGRAPRVWMLDAAAGVRGWHFVHAYGISAAGTILAVGRFNGGRATLVTLAPVARPAAR